MPCLDLDLDLDLRPPFPPIALGQGGRGVQIQRLKPESDNQSTKTSLVRVRHDKNIIIGSGTQDRSQGTEGVSGGMS